MSDRDPFEILRDALRTKPSEPLSDQQVAEIVQRAITAPPTKLSSPKPRLRHWLLIVGVGIGVSAAGGLAIAVLNREHVVHPEGGVACRAEADPLSSAVVIGQLSSDPIGDCAAIWSNRGLPDTESPDNNNGIVPRLIACLGPGGGIDVLPVEAGITCESLGLRLADIETAASDPALELQRRFSEELPRCSSVAAAEVFARKLLDELELTDWHIVVRPGDLPCALTGVEAEITTVFIVPGPRPPSQTTTEGPP